MNLYEENLYDLYSSCFLTSLKRFIKGKSKFEKIALITMFVSLGTFIFSVIGVMFKIIFLPKILSFSLWIFAVSFLTLAVYLLINKKKIRILDMKNKEKKLAKFDSELEKYGYETDDKIKAVLNSIRLNYSDRCKVKERKFDNFFKIFITFWVPGVIFISKEKWGQMKNQISQEYFDAFFEMSAVILGVLAIVIIYGYMISRDIYGNKKEEKLIEALEEVLIYRRKIKLYIRE